MSRSYHCRIHPERPAAAICQKYGQGLCAECLENHPHCSDPTIYCKFRPQCIVSFREKEMRRQKRQGGPA